MSRYLQTTLTVLSLTLLFACQPKQNESEEKWLSLFNGKDLEGWIPKFHKSDVGENYLNTFRVTNGVLQANYDNYTQFEDRYGHLFYETPFSSYHLKFEYRFLDQWVKDASSFTFRNSGVMIHSQDPHTILKEQDWPISVEFQLLADADDGKSRPTGNVCTPGTEVFFDKEMTPLHCVRSSSPTYPWNQWIQGEIIVYSDSLIFHIINNDTVLQYTKPQIGGDVVRRFNPKQKLEGKPLKNGFIALQAEGQGIEFRSILIKQLNK